MRVGELFEPDHSIAWPYLSRFTWPWEALPGVGRFVAELGATLDDSEYERRGPDVWIHKTASVAASAYIGHGVIICAGAEVRHCAYIREATVVGAGAVVGNSTELKNAILFDSAQVPHFNYIGDSVLGHKSHMGAGAIASNVRLDHTNISVTCSGARFSTGIRKFGVILGDRAEVGCNAVAGPGCVIGRGALVYPLSFVRGFVPANCIYKKQGEIVSKL